MSKHHPIVEEDLRLIVATVKSWEVFSGKTILVSGANGFLPSYMIFSLLKANEMFDLNLHIVGLARNKERAEAKFGGYLGKYFSLLFQDVAQKTLVDRKIDFIVHAASQASPKYYGVDPVGTLNANVLGTNQLLLLAKDHNSVGFLYFSSSEVYGQMEEKFIPTREDQFGYIDIANVRSCYAEGKRLGETMCVSWWKQHGIPVKIVRPFHTYGPGMDLSDGRVYADFVSNILMGKDITIKSDGSAKRAFCYLSDATIGFFTVLIQGEKGEAYNVGNPNGEISIYELAQLLSSLFPEKGVRVTRELNKDQGYLKSLVTRNCPDIGKLQNCGWNPKYSVSEGFSRTIKSYA
jgi:UDP-glucuronate decarboxylase